MMRKAALGYRPVRGGGGEVIAIAYDHNACRYPSPPGGGTLAVYVKDARTRKYGEEGPQ